MAHLPRKQPSREKSARKRPQHITLPTTSSPLSIQPPPKHLTSSEQVERQETTPSPKPPIPPRRHTLAEICRYADEQCAYIEWMTRELEAEEACRRHSSPTTPAGAITNPFNGRADMWWRPNSAEEMYGTSVLRRKHEEGSQGHPYLVTMELSELTETTKNRLDDQMQQLQIDSANSAIIRFQAGSEPTEPFVMCASDQKAMLEHSSSESLKDIRDVSISQEHQRRILSDQDKTPPLEQALQQKSGSTSINLVDGSTLLIIPKVLLCLFLLPLALLVGWFGDDSSEEVENEESE